MRFAFAIALILSGLLVASCGSGDSDQGSTESAPKTVEVTRNVTVVRTVEAEGPFAPGAAPGAGGATRERLPGPAVPQAEETLQVGETADLESGASLTLVSTEAGVPEDEASYRPDSGAEFFVVDIEACVPETAAEPVLFSPRDFRLLGSDEVRRIATAPAKTPALRPTRVSPGNCEEGWVTFQIEEGADPGSVIFEGSSVVRWDLGSG